MIGVVLLSQQEAYIYWSQPIRGLEIKIKSWWFGEVYQITLTTGSRYHLSVFAPIHTALAAARWTQIVSNVACFPLFSAIQFLFLTPLQWRYLASCHSACHSPPCSDILDIKSSRKMLELLYKGFVNSADLRQIRTSLSFACFVKIFLQYKNNGL